MLNFQKWLVMNEAKKRWLMIIAIIGIPIASYALFSSRGLLRGHRLSGERRSLAGRIAAARAEQGFSQEPDCTP